MAFATLTYREQVAQATWRMTWCTVDVYHFVAQCDSISIAQIDVDWIVFPRFRPVGFDRMLLPKNIIFLGKIGFHTILFYKPTSASCVVNMAVRQEKFFDVSGVPAYRSNCVCDCIKGPFVWPDSVYYDETAGGFQNKTGCFPLRDNE